MPRSGYDISAFKPASRVKELGRAGGINAKSANSDKKKTECQSGAGGGSMPVSLPSILLLNDQETNLSNNQTIR